MTPAGFLTPKMAVVDMEATVVAAAMAAVKEEFVTTGKMDLVIEVTLVGFRMKGMMVEMDTHEAVADTVVVATVGTVVEAEDGQGAFAINGETGTVHMVMAVVLPIARTLQKAAEAEVALEEVDMEEVDLEVVEGLGESALNGETQETVRSVILVGLPILMMEEEMSFRAVVAAVVMFIIFVISGKTETAHMEIRANFLILRLNQKLFRRR